LSHKYFNKLAKWKLGEMGADDIPVAVAAGEIAIKDGTINYYDGEYDQQKVLEGVEGLFNKK
jgi:hypothetical protein